MTLKTSIGGASLIQVYDMSDALICEITNFKGATRTGHPAKGVPIKFAIDSYQNDFANSGGTVDLIDDYLTNATSDTITIDNELGEQMILYAAEDVALATLKYFKFIKYDGVNKGTSPLTRDVFYGIGMLTGNTGDKTTAGKTPVNMPLEITSIACPASDITFAINDFDTDLVTAPLAAKAIAIGSYGVVEKMAVSVA